MSRRKGHGQTRRVESRAQAVGLVDRPAGVGDDEKARARAASSSRFRGDSRLWYGDITVCSVTTAFCGTCEFHTRFRWSPAFHLWSRLTSH